jgi:hypothetical protein
MAERCCKRFDSRESCVQQCGAGRYGERLFYVTAFAIKHI